MRSMTGYGRGEHSDGASRAVVRARSVNHRSLDVRVRSDGELGATERALMGEIRERVARGRVELTIELTYVGEASARRWEAAEAAVGAARELAERVGASPDVSLGDLMAAGWDRPSAPSPADDEAVAHVVKAAVSQAVAALVAEREREGEALARWFDDELAAVETTLEAIERRHDEVRPARVEALRVRVDEVLSGRPESAPTIEDSKLIAEIVRLVDRAEIAEELQRARSHAEALRRLVAADGRARAVGKKLDFTLQELLREANTMGSKSSDAAMTGSVVELKAAVERMREQAANVE